MNQSPKQQLAGSAFTVSYASDRLQRKQQSMSAMSKNNNDKKDVRKNGPSSPSSKLADSGRSAQWTSGDLDFHQLPSNLREDIPREQLESQHAQAVQCRTRALEEANAQDCQRISRAADWDKFYLRILVGEAVNRQAKFGKHSAFLAKIMTAAKVAAKRGKKDLIVKAEEVEDYNFVSQSMARDIQVLLPQLGYSVTLHAISSLQIWQLG